MNKLAVDRVRSRANLDNGLEVLHVVEVVRGEVRPSTSTDRTLGLTDLVAKALLDLGMPSKL